MEEKWNFLRIKPNFLSDKKTGYLSPFSNILQWNFQYTAVESKIHCYAFLRTYVRVAFHERMCQPA